MILELFLICLSDSPASEDFVDLEESLISVFKNKYIQFDRMSASKARVQVPIKSVSEFKEALLILYKQAGEPEEGRNTNPFSRNHFIERLLPQIRKRVRMEVPLTVKEALNFAERTKAALGMWGNCFCFSCNFSLC